MSTTKTHYRALHNERAVTLCGRQITEQTRIALTIRDTSCTRCNGQAKTHRAL